MQALPVLSLFMSCSQPTTDLPLCNHNLSFCTSLTFCLCPGSTTLEGQWLFTLRHLPSWYNCQLEEQLPNIYFQVLFVMFIFQTRFPPFMSYSMEYTCYMICSTPYMQLSDNYERFAVIEKGKPESLTWDKHMKCTAIQWLFSELY